MIRKIENKKERRLIMEIDKSKLKKLTNLRRLERNLRLSRVWKINMMMKRMSRMKIKINDSTEKSKINAQEKVLHQDEEWILSHLQADMGKKRSMIK
jgi:hypothetical protein